MMVYEYFTRLLFELLLNQKTLKKHIAWRNKQAKNTLLLQFKHLFRAYKMCEEIFHSVNVMEGRLI